MQPRILCQSLAPGRVTLAADASHHLAVVLRSQPADRITVFDGTGREAQAVIVHVSKSEVQIDVGDITVVNREAPNRVTVVQALCVADKMDWVVQKSTELGASRIIPLAARRSVMKLDGDRAAKRRTHWQSVAQSAAAQCGRTQVPVIDAVATLSNVMAQWQASTSPKTGWLLDPFADQTLGAATLSGEITILIGPEAGWSDDEEALARSAGFCGIRCGPRILRTETVASVILSAIAVKAGEF